MRALSCRIAIGRKTGTAQLQNEVPDTPRKGAPRHVEARACNAPPDLRESLRQVLWALGFAGLGVSDHVLLSRLRR